MVQDTPGNSGDGLLFQLSPPTIHSLQQYNPLDRVPEQEVQRLGLESLTQGAFPLHSFSQGTSYYAASLIARLLSGHPEYAGEFAADIPRERLLLDELGNIPIPQGLAEERLAVLERHGVIAVKNGSVPIRQLDIILSDYRAALLGRPKEYQKAVIDLQQNVKQHDEETRSCYTPLFDFPASWDRMVTARDSPRTVDQYFLEIKRYKLLTVEEERELAGRYRQGDQQAFQQLVLSNLRFVATRAHHYKKKCRNLSLLDLIQVGNMGLMKAITRYDPERGIRLVSYARHWIDAYLKQALFREGRTIQTSRRYSSEYGSALAFEERFTKEHGRPLTREEAQDTLERRVTNRVLDIENNAVVAYSLNDVVSTENDMERHGTLEDRSGLDSLQQLMQEQTLHDRLYEALDKLSPIEQSTIKQYLGFDGMEAISVGELAEEHGMSKGTLANTAVPSLITKLKAVILDGIPKHAVPQHVKDTVRHAFESLDERLQNILCQHLGIGRLALSLRKIGDMHQTSGEWIRQLESSALQTLRNKTPPDYHGRIEEVLHLVVPDISKDEISK